MKLNSRYIGDKIAAARKKANLSQAELARQVSISAQAVGKWERGESMPDITTLNRLAEILGVDLNYFSERFQTADQEETTVEPVTKQSTEGQKKKPGWDMSGLNLVDGDFSGLKNLQEKFSSSNMKNCKFVGSDLSGLILKNNHVDSCDFSGSDISNSHIQGSFFAKDVFKDCLLKESTFSKSYVESCDFTGADFTGTEFKSGGFGKNTLYNAVLNGATFVEMQFQEVTFEGTLEDCRFENCTFYGVTFQNATLVNTFFKNNEKFKRVQFINCRVDNITHAFLKTNGANLAGVTLLSPQ